MKAMFSEDGKEYIIDSPYTPARWLNYLSNGSYCAFFRTDGGGYSFWKDPSYHGLTSWSESSQNLSRVIYLKSGDDYWRVNFPEPDSNWEGRIGMDCQTVRNMTRGIEANLTYFVPLDKDLEYWCLQIKNRERKDKNLHIFAVTELSLGNALRSYLSHEMNLYGRGWEENGVLYATCSLWGRGSTMVENVNWPMKAFFTSTHKFRSFDCNKISFVGNSRTSLDPIAVERGRCNNNITWGRTPIFALHFVVKLKAGEQKEMAFALGAVEENSVAPKINIEQVKEDRRKTRQFWENISTDGIFVQTPDKNLNTAINYWNRKQALIDFWWYRTASAPHLIELDMCGFRDATQTIIGIIPLRPQWAREKILKLAGCQYQKGCWTHMFDLLTYKGPASTFSDVHLWLPMVVFCYLKETGDFALLKERIPFQDGEKASVWEHIKRTLRFMADAKGPHKLTLLKGGDWNDGLNFAGKEGKGESVMVSQTLYLVLQEWAELNGRLSKQKECRWALKEAKELKKALHQYCWDGAWYIRAYTDNGKVLGSKRCKEGKIFLNVQSWAVISGSVSKERAKKCMDSVEKLLETPFGPKIQHPSYSRIDSSKGLISRCAPGEGENGSIFMHPIPWAIQAMAKIKNIKAYEYYKNSLFINTAKDERYRAEPYVYPEIISGPESPHYGEGMRGWLTGAAAWFFRVCTDYILGIIPEYDGLRIDPCIDPNWGEYKILRTFRGKKLSITVKNPQKVHWGVAEIILNGQTIESNFLPCKRLKKNNKVEIIMGKSNA